MSQLQEVQFTTALHQEYKAVCKALPQPMPPAPRDGERSTSPSEGDKILALIRKFKN